MTTQTKPTLPKADRISDSQLHHHTRLYLGQVAEGRIVITTDSKPVAVLISMEDAALLERVKAEGRGDA